MKKLMLNALAASLVLCFGACEKNEDPVNNEEGGSMDVYMTDAPANYEAILMSVSEVEVYSNSEGWVRLNASGETFNILDFNNGNTKRVATANQLDIGLYTKLRVHFNQDIQLETVHDIKLLNGQSQGSFQLEWMSSNTIELEINESVEAGNRAEVIIDFDAAKSIVENGEKFLIRPVLRYIDDTRTGLEGELNSSAEAMIRIENGQFSASANVNATGEFQFNGLEEGTYTLVVYCMQEVNGEMKQQSKTINDVAVVEGEITHIGEIQL